MKLIHSDGRTMTARDVGPVVVRLNARDVPLPCVRVIEDDALARRRLASLLATGLYDREGERR